MFDADVGGVLLGYPDDSIGVVVKTSMESSLEAFFSKKFGGRLDKSPTCVWLSIVHGIFGPIDFQISIDSMQ